MKPIYQDLELSLCLDEHVSWRTCDVFGTALKAMHGTRETPAEPACIDELQVIDRLTGLDIVSLLSDAQIELIQQKALGEDQ